MISFRDVFGLKDGIEIDLDTDLPGASDVREKLSGVLPESDWPIVRDHIARTIGELFDVDVIDVILGAWTTHELLEQYADPNRYPPEEKNFVALTDHEIESRHHPEIEILVGETVIETIKFDLTLKLALEGIILVVQHARVTHVRSARMRAGCVLGCRGAMLFEKEATVVVPGEWALGDGIDLRGLAGDRSPVQR